MNGSNRRRLWIALLALAAAVGCGYWYWHHHRYKHFAVHDPGLVYRSAWVEPDVMSELIETYQFRTVLNLCEPGEMGEQRWIDERRAVTNAGARLVEVSMPATVDPEDPQFAKYVTLLNDPDNYPLLVHCQHGVTRTAKLLAMYDMLYRGMTAEESLTSMPLFGREDHNVHVKGFAYNFEKRRRQLYPQISSDELDVLRR